SVAAMPLSRSAAAGWSVRRSSSGGRCAALIVLALLAPFRKATVEPIASKNGRPGYSGRQRFIQSGLAARREKLASTLRVLGERHAERDAYFFFVSDARVKVSGGKSGLSSRSVKK